MPDHDLIERYLTELDAKLRLPSRSRRRIVAEARDHLRELVEDDAVEDEAAAQSRAIEAFGPPAIIAERFARELAIGASRRAARTGTVMFVMSLVLCGVCTSSFIHIAPGWLSDGPGSLLLWIVAQVALAAGVTSLARARMARRTAGADTIRLRYVVRGLIVLSVCAGFTVGIAAAGIATAVISGGRSVVLLATLTLASAVVTTSSARATWAAHRRLSTLDEAPVTASGREALHDVVSTAGAGLHCVTRHLPRADALRDAIAAHTPPPPRWLKAFDPRNHPWRYGALIALLAGCALPVLDFAVLVLRGQLDAYQLGQLALLSPALIAFEAALVLTGYATLGPYLGLRPTRTPDLQDHRS